MLLAAHAGGPGHPSPPAGAGRAAWWIALTAALLVAAIWLMAGSLVGKERQQAVSAETTLNANLALAHEERIARSLQAFDQFLLLLRDDIAQRGKPPDLRQRAAAAQLDPRFVNVVTVVDAQGNVVATTAEAAPINVSDRPYFQAHATDPTDRLLIAPPILGRMTGKWGVFLTRRMNAPDGNFAGLVLMAIDPAYFATVYASTSLRPDSSQALIGLDGITVARRNGDTISFGDDARKSQLFKELPQATSGHYVAVAASDGQLRTISYRQVAGQPLVVVVASSLARVLESVRERERIYWAVAALTTLLVLAVAALAVFTLRRHARSLATVGASELQYRQLFENNLDAVLRVDGAGRVLATNAAACALLRASQAQLREAGAWSLSVADDPRLPALLQARQRDGRARGELTWQRHDGSRFEAEVETSRYLDGDGRDMASLILRDVTDRRRAEAAQQHLDVQLREAQKMESLGTLAGGIAHDFNNILASILGNVAMLRDDLRGDSPGARRLALIDQAALRARALVQQILTFSRRQTEERRPQPLQPLVEDALALLRATLPAQVRLVVQLAAEPLTVHTDATQMQQVVVNLCTNAVQALHGGKGKVEVTLEAVVLDGSGAGQRPGRHALLRVRDDGAGMDAATLQRIFEPFFTTKPVGQGTGLGLAVVHGIVATHGGSVQVDSAPGAGTCFDVLLPLADVPADVPKDALADALPAATEPPPTLPAAPALHMPHRQHLPHLSQGRGQHLLYVDDDEVLRITVENLLQRSGYRVTCHGDPRAALSALHADPTGFDLVISDYNMPELSGLDLARATRRLRPELPVVITSGYVSDELHAGAREAGVWHVMHKQYTVERLVGVVESALSARSAP